MARREPDQFMTMGQASAAYDVSRITLWRAVRAGKLEAFESGRDRRERLLRRADIEAFVAPRPVGKKVAG